MRGLAEDGNPYAGRYGAWDEWIMANAPGSTSQDIYAWYRGEAPRGYCVLATAVDKDGWPIPAVEFVRARQDPDSEIHLDSCVYMIEAGGQIKASLLEEYHRAVAQAKGAWAPAIPKWLADSPPKLAQFYGGDVLAFGEPGSGRRVWEDGLAEVLKPGSGDVWRRYSLDGELLGETERAEEWWRLYFAGFTDVLTGLGGEPAVAYFAYQGYVVFWDSKTQAVLAVYDYLGNEQPKDTDFFNSGFEDPLLQPIPGGELPWIYEAQRSSKD